MKTCELCSYGARTYCESDEASLCWTCDEKIHGANFLVAKHIRILLCHLCQAQTPWTASGPKLTPTLSVCETCVDTHNQKQDEGIDGNGESDGEEENDEFTDDEEYDEELEDEDEEEEENQVVPGTIEAETAAITPPAASSSSSSSEGRESSFGCGRRVVKRTRQIDFDEEIEFCSSQLPNVETNGSMHADDDDQTESSRSTAIINSLKRLQKQRFTEDDNQQQSSETIIGICNLTRDGTNL